MTLTLGVKIGTNQFSAVNFESFLAQRNVSEAPGFIIGQLSLRASVLAGP